MKPNKIAKMIVSASLPMIMLAFSLITVKAYGAEVPADVSVQEQCVSVVTTSAVQEEETTDMLVDDQENNTDKISKNVEDKVKAAPKADYTKEELRLMSAIIWCEARGESKAGKLAVGIVVMNRKASSLFPNSVRGVIYQKGQFSPTRNGSMKKALKMYKAGKFQKSKMGRECIAAAKKALQGEKRVKIKGKYKNLKSYHFFSQRLKGCRLRIGGHMFK